MPDVRGESDLGTNFELRLHLSSLTDLVNIRFFIFSVEKIYTFLQKC